MTGGLTAKRLYATASNPVPATWPQPPAGVTGIYSFKPALASVNHGTLDKAIVASLRALPVGSWVTIWHEANLANRGFQPGPYTAAVRHVERLIVSRSIPVRFGQIFGTYAVNSQGQNLSLWVVPGLAFYGMDGYDHATHLQTPTEVFGKSFAEIRQAYPAASLAVMETGVSNGTASQTNQWADSAWSYACQQGVSAFMLWAIPGAQINLPAPYTMRRLAADAARGAC
jgi:hypothetical protein